MPLMHIKGYTHLAFDILYSLCTHYVPIIPAKNHCHILAGDVYVWHTSLGLSPLCHCHCEGSVKGVLLPTSGPPTFAAMSDHELKVQMSDSNGQWTCLESKNYEAKVGK